MTQNGTKKCGAGSDRKFRFAVLRPASHETAERGGPQTGANSLGAKRKRPEIRVNGIGAFENSILGLYSYTCQAEFENYLTL